MIRNNNCFYFSGDPFQYGGGATVANNLLMQIAKLESKSLLIVSNYADIPHEIEDGFQVIRLWMPKNRMLMELFDQLIMPFVLLLLMPKRVICLNSILPLLYPFRMDLFFQMRMFYFEELDSFSKKIKNLLGRLSAKRANNLYCASKDHANDLISHLKLRPSKVKVIHLGFKMENQVVDSTIGTQLERNDRLLFVSVIRPYKNLHGLVRSVIQAKIKRPDLPIHLDIVGKPANYVGIDGYMDDIHSEIAESNAQSYFTFVGSLPHEDVVTQLGQCKALVFPTKFEGFGFPLLEAMAMQSPVICSSVNSLPEIALDTVIYFDVNDADSLSSRIIDLYEQGYPQKMISLAYKRARLFRWDMAANALMNNDNFIVE